MEETQEYSFEKELEDADVLADRYVEFFNGLTRMGTHISSENATAMTVALIHAENALPAITQGGSLPPLTGAN